MKSKLKFIYLLLLLLPAYLIHAQEKGADKKSDEDIVNEYKSWSSIRDDWPNLGRYQEANSELKAPVQGENRVVFMGNPITDGSNKITILEIKPAKNE